MSDISRIRKLAGIFEANEEILSQDQVDDMQDEEDMARYAREDKIKRLIFAAFKRLEIDLYSENPIFYDEENDREAIVRLDDSSIAVSKLAALQNSGLSDDYIVSIGTEHTLDITFTVSPNLDHAIRPKKGS